MTEYRVVLDTELWLYRTPEGLRLDRPAAVDRLTGQGMPGVLSPPPIVLRPGQALRILLPARPSPPFPVEDCPACAIRLALAAGDDTLLPLPPVLVHHHAPTRQE